MPTLYYVCTDRDCPEGNVPVPITASIVARHVIDVPNPHCTSCRRAMYQITDMEVAREALAHHPEALEILDRALEGKDATGSE